MDSETKNESLQQEIVELQKMLNDTGDENANQLLEIQGKLSALKINQKAHEKKKMELEHALEQSSRARPN